MADYGNATNVEERPIAMLPHTHALLIIVYVLIAVGKAIFKIHVEPHPPYDPLKISQGPIIGFGMNESPETDLIETSHMVVMIKTGIIEITKITTITVTKIGPTTEIMIEGPTTTGIILDLILSEIKIITEIIHSEMKTMEILIITIITGTRITTISTGPPIT